jgi:hypothetical protein
VPSMRVAWFVAQQLADGGWNFDLSVAAPCRNGTETAA